MSPSPPPGEPRSHPATTGLLEYLTAHPMDDDYLQVASRPADRGHRGAVVTVLTIAAFCLLLITAATQTSRDAVADAHERTALIRQIEDHRAELKRQDDQISSLQAQIGSLRTGLVHNTKLSTGVRARLSLLSNRAGTVAVRGPGVSATVDDAPNATNQRQTVLDTDLRAVVNGLWQAGAEAIAINGHRLTTLSAIREAGSAITVNYASLNRPYVVDAIGDPATLPTGFEQSSTGAAWLDLQQQIGLRFTLRTRTSMRLPAAPQPDLRYAKPPATSKRAAS